MNPFALAAIALTSVSGRNDGDSAARDWLALDRDIEALATAAAPAADDGAEVSGYIKAAYRRSSDIMVGGNDEGGVVLQNVRVNAKGKVGPMELKVSIDGAKGPIELKDAFGRFALCDAVHAQMGNFKSPFLLTAVSSDEKEIFFDRSTQGALWSGREPGFQVDGVHGAFAWWAAAQNGGDEAGDELLLIGRAAYAIHGDPIQMKQTGGFGTDSPTRVQAALGFADDSSAIMGDASVVAGELTAIIGPVFAHAEVLDYGDGFVPANGVLKGNASKAAAANVGDTTPFGITLGYLVTEKDEITVRYDDLDDANDARVYWAGYTRYVEGHAAKWQLNWISRESDAGDVDELVVGLTVNI